MAVAATNLDVNSIVSQLMVLERQPLTQLDVKEASYQAKISAYGTIKGALSSLQSAVKTLTLPGTFQSLTVASSNTAIASGSADTSADTGGYSLTVDKLAKYNTLRSDGAYTASTNTLNTGTLSIKVGTGSTVNITIDSTNNTLAGIRSAINNSGAGVTASIVNDGTNQRLLISSNTSGSAGAVTVTATDSGSGGTFALSDLDSSKLVETQAADDAEFSVNGLSITRSSNTVSDVIPGLTLTLSQTGSTAISVSKNNANVVSAVQAFVTAYNSVVTQNQSLSAYDATNQSAAILTGDSTVRSIQDRLANLMGTKVDGIAGGLAYFSSVGIELADDGTLILKSDVLTSALNNPDNDIKNLFTQTTAGNQGLAVQLNNWLSDATGSDGIIANRISGISSSIQSLEDQRSALASRLTLIQARYQSQYSALDALISSMNSTSTFLEQQLAALPGATKSK
ncbi:MAG TPA: flagellar filament capping protein FliD [Rhodocyclaceae bacterium]|nr:flagellar filament capping protein FliD [Rhodocyclaceae bacterium]